MAEILAGKALFTPKDSYMLRGIAIIMVTASHYVEWCAEQLNQPVIQMMVSRMGKYGVDIFFLLSGYALVKTTIGKRIDGRFILKRMKNMYLPYLIISGIIEIYAGGEVTGTRVVRYLLGMDYWFIFNILLFYMVFFVIWKIGKCRIALMGVFTAGFTWYLYQKGNHDFWYVSNMAFFIGVVCGQYENKILGMRKLWYVILTGVLAVLTGAVIYSGMNEAKGLIPENMVVWSQLAANMIWTLFVLFASQLIFLHSRVLMFLGNISLYLYMFHTFLYYQVLNKVNLEFKYQFPLTLIITVAASWLLSMLIRGIWAVPGLVIKRAAPAAEKL